MISETRRVTFEGWRVVSAAFVLAIFGWGLGFYGPPVFLKVLHERHGWPVGLISSAVTVHFLVGACSGANMPAFYRRFGMANVTRACAIAMTVGLLIWGAVREPWQMFAAGFLTGAGWGGMSAAAINAIVSRWFDRKRPAALGMAYNGGSVGGIVFSPLWVVSIDVFGFLNAVTAIAGTMMLTVWFLAGRYFSRAPEQMGLAPDGEVRVEPSRSVDSMDDSRLSGRLLWRNWRFITLSVAMACGLFAQIGLIAHLYSLLTPALGSRNAGLAMALITAMAIAGRTLLGWTMPVSADRRLVASAGYVAQVVGSLAFYLAGGETVWLLLSGVILFGLGFGNATSLPPLIAQVEFVKNDVTRVVALVVGIAQGLYAFAPAAFGMIRDYAPASGIISPGAAPLVFIAAALFQCAAIAALLAGRRPRHVSDLQ